MNKSIHYKAPVVHRPGEYGFSLVEMLVGMLISMLLLTGLVTLMTDSNQTYRDLNAGTEQQENGRYALHLLKEDIRHAGFYGEFYNRGKTINLPDPCDLPTTDVKEEAQLPFHLQGYNDDSMADGSCFNKVGDDYKAGTDVLVIRRAQLNAPGLAPASASVDKSKLYIQSAPDDVIVDTGIVAAASNATDTFKLLKYGSTTQYRDIRQYHVIIYYVANNNVAGDGIPTLKRKVLSLDGTGTPQWGIEPLVEGIEDMQLDYGVATEASRGRPLTYKTTIANAAEWMYVTTVQVNLLARTINPSADRNFTDTKTYNMGVKGVVNLADDGYKRHVYTSTVRITNIAGLLDTTVPDNI